MSLRECIGKCRLRFSRQIVPASIENEILFAYISMKTYVIFLLFYKLASAHLVTDNELVGQI